MEIRVTARGTKASQKRQYKEWYICYMDDKQKYEPDKTAKKDAKASKSSCNTENVDESAKIYKEEDKAVDVQKEPVVFQVVSEGSVTALKMVDTGRVFRQRKDERMAVKHFYRRKGKGWRVFRDIDHTGLITGLSA